MPEERANIGEAVETVAGILTGQPDSSEAAAPTEAEPEAQPQADSEPEATELTPKAIAEALGVTPDKLFTEMLIPLDGGEPLTLEEFKASGKELRELKAAQHELAEQRIAHENDVMMQKQTLEAAIAKIPPDALTGEMVAEVQAEHQATLQRERSALLTIRPDLREPAKWSSTRDLLVTHLKPYGFKEIEVDSIVDHRLAKYVIDNAEREKRLKEIDAESLEPEQPARVNRSSQKARPAKAKPKQETGAKRQSDQADKVAKVAELIGAKQDG